MSMQLIKTIFEYNKPIKPTLNIWVIFLTAEILPFQTLVETLNADFRPRLHPGKCGKSIVA